MSDGNDVISPPWDQRVADFRQRQLPLLVWLVCVAICGWMLLDRTQPADYVGLAQAVQYEISAPAVGRVDTVFVELYQSVQKGDLVVKMDDAELDAQIEGTQAAIRSLQARVVAARGQLESSNMSGVAGWTNDLRRFQTDEEGRRLDALESRASIEADEIQLERLRLREARLGPLVSEGIVDPMLYDELRLEIAEVSSRVENTRVLLNQIEEEYRSARARRLEYESKSPDLPDAERFLDPLRESIEVEAQRLRKIEMRRAALTMESPIDGQVSQILCRSGQNVVEGEPIIMITDRAVQNIVTYLSASDDREIAPNTPVLVSNRQQPPRVAESVVLRVSGSVELLPERLWPGVTNPLYGRAVVIAALPSMPLRPGEELSIRFLDE